MDRTETQTLFVNRFHIGSDPVPVAKVDLEELEKKLDTKLPKSFIQFLTTFGPIYCPKMLGTIVDRELDLWDVNNIYEAKESIESTEAYWSGGMPTDYVVFGNDCMGNAFCFKKMKETMDDSAVFFFDHDYVTVDQLADSFDSWLEKYLNLLPDEN